MPLNYTTSSGDVLDYIAWQHYGAQQAAVTMAIYDANPGLADQGPVLPLGLTILLPDIENTTDTTTSSDGAVSLWT